MKGRNLTLKLLNFPDASLFVLHCPSVITRDVLVQVPKALRAARRRGLYRGLIDLRRTSRFEVGFIEALGLADAVSSALRGRKHPLSLSIMAPDDLVYGMARMFEQVMERPGALDIRVRRSRYEAVRALGLEHVPPGLLTAPLFSPLPRPCCKFVATRPRSRVALTGANFWPMPSRPVPRSL